MPAVKSIPKVNILPSTKFRPINAGRFSWSESFRRAPMNTVSSLHALVKKDVRSGKSLKDYSALKAIKTLDPDTMSKLGGFIKQNYSLLLQIPGNKISLAPYKAELAMQSLEQYNPEHIAVMLSSIDGMLVVPADNKEPLIYSQYWKDIELLRPMVDRKGNIDDSWKTVFCNGGEVEPGNYGSVNLKLNGVDVEIIEGDDVPEKEKVINNFRLIGKIFNMVRDFNIRTPKTPVRKIVMTRTIFSHFGEKTPLFFAYEPVSRMGIDLPINLFRNDDTIHLGYYQNDDGTLAALAHELGHGVYLGLSPEDQDDWNSIYYFSLGYNRYELFHESNVFRSSYVNGHPYDDPGELFASSLASYILSPKSLAKLINDPDNSKEMRDFGIMLWCFMRESGFKNKLSNDPFKGYATQDFAGFLGSETQMRKTLFNALRSKNATVRENAHYVLVNGWGLIGPNDNVKAEQ